MDVTGETTSASSEMSADRKSRFNLLAGHLEARRGGTMADRRTGYYVAGRDWPAISNDIPLTEIYRALDGIDDNAVGAAMQSLEEVRVPD
jgi:hypothetical protein